MLTKIKRSLRYSIIEGSLWSVMAGFGEMYVRAFSIFLGATNLQLGLIASLPLFLGTLSQLMTGKLMQFFHSKRRFVYLFAYFQSFVWIPMFYIMYINMKSPVWILLFLFSLYWVLGAVAVPAWSSWMAELVDIKIRGSYFGRRSQITGFFSFFSYVIAGLVLHYATINFGTPELGFLLLFSLAAIARIFSSYFLSKQHEIHPKYEEDNVSLGSFLKHITENNYGFLTLFLVLMHFSVYIASPYFVAYLLKDLHLTYLNFMLVTAVALIIRYLTIPVWGKMNDEYGALKILTAASFMLPIIPILWLFSSSLWYLILIQVYAGFSWAGFELGAFNFLLDTADPHKRIHYLSYYNIIGGFMILIGSLCGAIILKFNNFFSSRYMLVFLLSGILRFFVVFALVHKIKEVRPVSPVRYRHMFFRMLTMLTTIGIHHHHQNITPVRKTK